MFRKFITAEPQALAAVLNLMRQALGDAATALADEAFF